MDPGCDRVCRSEVVVCSRSCTGLCPQGMHVRLREPRLAQHCLHPGHGPTEVLEVDEEGSHWDRGRTHSSSLCRRHLCGEYGPSLVPQEPLGSMDLEVQDVWCWVPECPSIHAEAVHAAPDCGQQIGGDPVGYVGGGLGGELAEQCLGNTGLNPVAYIKGVLDHVLDAVEDIRDPLGTRQLWEQSLRRTTEGQGNPVVGDHSVADLGRGLGAGPAKAQVVPLGRDPRETAQGCHGNVVGHEEPSERDPLAAKVQVRAKERLSQSGPHSPFDRT